METSDSVRLRRHPPDIGRMKDVTRELQFITSALEDEGVLEKCAK